MRLISAESGFKSLPRYHYYPPCLLLIVVYNIYKGGEKDSTETVKQEWQAEVPRGLVKHAVKKIIANDYDYALAA